jgi:ubiquinol-cytochrome c reductase subunit 8
MGCPWYFQRPHNPRAYAFMELTCCSGSLPQKGVTTYALAPNRQNPMAGTFNAAIFNTFRRTRHQILYWGLPLLVGYETMQWAIER